MTTTYTQRMGAIPKYPFMTGPVPKHGVLNPISDLLGEYYRRIARWESPPRAALPPRFDTVAGWFGTAVIASDVEQISRDVEALNEAVRAKGGQTSIAMTGLYRAILLWSLLVDRGELSLEADPSVPMLAIFEAGYWLNQVSHGLEIWGEVPWTINPGDVLRHAGLW